MSPGLMSAGIGEVPSEQTFLDVSQGNRVDDVLYDGSLPGLFPFAREVPGWSEVIARAHHAPADLEPGLLARRLRGGGVPVSAEQPMRAPALVAAGPDGFVSPSPPGTCVRRRCPGLAVVSANAAELSALAARLRDDDLLIALSAPPPGEHQALPIGIDGRGFRGDLTSDSTRTDGYVLSTDLGPTILERFGLSIPDEMDGEPVRAEGTPNPAAVDDLGRRMAVIPGRRAPLLIVCLSCWLAAAAALAVLRPQARRTSAAWLALAFAYLPLTLLAGAALEPSGLAEGLLAGVGAGALAALTIQLVRGWGALAISCAMTVLAYAIDVAAGSELTKLSLLGPNPILGVRFYGIGNELEALFAVMVPVAVGAGLSAKAGWGRGVGRTAAIAAFSGAAALAAVIFAAGRFGADVGAAIVLPIGAAVAAASLPVESSAAYVRYSGEKAAELAGGRSRRRAIVDVIAAPIVGLALLALIDLVSGGNAHLTRSVLDAGGAGDLADIAGRRLTLSAHDFAQAAGNPLFWIVVLGIGIAMSRWRRIDAWLRPTPMARAGVLGACAAVASGVLVNDSGATFLVLGALALGASLAFAWSRAPGRVQ
jgi:hypothetical protein